jgi:hypothetical protein
MQECWSYVRSHKNGKFRVDSSLHVHEAPTEFEAKLVHYGLDAPQTIG